ncbi:hypothetical protein IEQ34_021106 [Dendrobium chrysotoxum]|uniref:Uncharacterized protein n=1 Tax=Dendrobium chrysotoxum TaxID=161865 RepID=A0AAV7G391_DENCH|nr:hypothetical protein IEQ34_021106 [Dendrobium chrysotoxum]
MNSIWLRPKKFSYVQKVIMSDFLSFYSHCKSIGLINMNKKKVVGESADKLGAGATFVATSSEVHIHIDNIITCGLRKFGPRLRPLCAFFRGVLNDLSSKFWDSYFLEFWIFGYLGFWILWEFGRHFWIIWNEPLRLRFVFNAAIIGVRGIPFESLNTPSVRLYEYCGSGGMLLHLVEAHKILHLLKALAYLPTTRLHIPSKFSLPVGLDTFICILMLVMEHCYIHHTLVSCCRRQAYPCSLFLARCVEFGTMIQDIHFIDCSSCYFVQAQSHGSVNVPVLV